MRKTVLATAAAGLLADTTTSVAVSADFWYRHSLPGAGATASPTNGSPTLTGTMAALSVEVGAAALPFAATEVADPENDTVVVTVTLDDTAKGAFSVLGGFADQGSGSYGFTGDPAAATVAVRGLAFTPAEDRLEDGESEDLSILLVVADLAGATASAATTLTINAPEPPTARPRRGLGTSMDGRR